MPDFENLTGFAFRINTSRWINQSKSIILYIIYIQIQQKSAIFQYDKNIVLLLFK